MNFEGLLSNILDMLGTSNPKIAILLFLFCLIGDAFTSVPYVLETIWIFAGYQLSKGVLPIYSILLFAVASQLGRQIGALILAYFGMIGSTPIGKCMKYVKDLGERIVGKNSKLNKLVNRINITSPFSVAFGRLTFLRIPLSLMLGARKQLKVLSIGVLISGIIFDAIFIVLGYVVGTSVTLKPIEIFLISFIALSLLYLISLAFQRFILPNLIRRK